MSSPQAQRSTESRLITARLAALLLPSILVYLTLAISVVSTCFEELEACGAFNRLIPDLSFIPLVGRPVDFLVSQTKFARAQAVLEAYSFTWALALVWIALMVLVAAIWILRMTKADADRFVAFYEDPGHYMNARQVRIGTMIFRLLGCGFLIWLYWGHFDFEGYATSNLFTNAVDRRNRDFYTPAIVWAGFMLCVWSVIADAVRARAFKISERKHLWIKL